MIKITKIIAFVLFIILVEQGAYAQSSTTGANVITTAVSFLTITPDSRAGGMGDAGVATSADVSSQHWNAAKYAFAESDMGVGI